jgi:hypothetical protein
MMTLKSCMNTNHVYQFLHFYAFIFLTTLSLEDIFHFPVGSSCAGSSVLGRIHAESGDKVRALGPIGKLDAAAIALSAPRRGRDNRSQ